MTWSLISECEYFPKEQQLREEDVHPMTKEPLTRLERYSTENLMNEVRYGPPRSPGREEWEIDDDGCEIPDTRRTLTDEEYAEAVRDYEKASKAWAESGGLMRTHAGQRFTAIFRTESGAWVEAEWGGDRWHASRAGFGDVAP